MKCNRGLPHSPGISSLPAREEGALPSLLVSDRSRCSFSPCHHGIAWGRGQGGEKTKRRDKRQTRGLSTLSPSVGEFPSASCEARTRTLMEPCLQPSVPFGVLQCAQARGCWEEKKDKLITILVVLEILVFPNPPATDYFSKSSDNGCMHFVQVSFNGRYRVECAYSILPGTRTLKYAFLQIIYTF